MINYDLTRRPSRASEWTALLDAVYDADPSDETSWIEWKSNLDLNDNAHIGGVLAKAIIAFANRLPVDAGSHLSGSALIIIGLEPGNVFGTSPMDTAVLDAKLTPYIGADGPGWEPHWLDYQGKKILIVEVLPPATGDLPHAFRKTSGKLQQGTVYVRKKAASVPADQADINALARRFASGLASQAPSISVHVKPQDALVRYQWTDAEVDQFVDQLRNGLLEPLRQHEQSERAKAAEPLKAARQAQFEISRLGFPQFMKSPETRSPQQYKNQIDKYVSEVRAELPGILMDVVSAVIPPLVFTATNGDGRNYSDVRVTLSVKGHATAMRKSSNKQVLARRLPQAPPPFGSTSQQRVGLDQAFISHRPRMQSKITNGESLELQLLEFNLRSGDAEITIEDEVVVLIPVSRVEPLVFSWRATASNVNGTAEGAFEVPFTEKGLDVLRLSQISEAGCAE